jgi:hypothetical protein
MLRSGSGIAEPLAGTIHFFPSPVTSRIVAAELVDVPVGVDVRGRRDRRMPEELLDGFEVHYVQPQSARSWE